MTKQYLEAFAAAIRQSDRSSFEKTAMFYLVVRVAQRFNPRFDSERFKVACGLAEVLR